MAKREISEDMKLFLGGLALELKGRGITNVQFARQMGVAKETVSYWINGRKAMTLDNYFKAMRILEADKKTLTNNKPEVNI